MENFDENEFSVEPRGGGIGLSNDETGMWELPVEGELTTAFSNITEITNFFSLQR
jgi:hypothetical protein